MSDRDGRLSDGVDRTAIASRMQQRFGTPVAARQGVLVTGMHRSGTSALTRVLSMLGCSLPGTLMGANDANPAGHWESNSICALNDEVLQIFGRTWRDWRPIDQRAFASLPVRALQPEARALLASEFGDAALFVLKDPRIAVLAPFWLDTFAQAYVEPAIVCPVRHPVEVARSLARRDGIDEGEGHLMWLRHVLAAETATRGRPRTFTTYDQLLRDWRGVVDRIGAELGVTWPRSPESRQAEVGAFLAGELRHHAVGSAEARADPHLSKWTNAVHAILVRWAEQGESAADHGTLDDITAAFDDASPVFAGLVARGGAAVERLRSLEAGAEAPAPREGADADLTAVTAKLKAAEAKIQALRDQLHDVDSRLRQRDEEVSQAWAEVSITRAEAQQRTAQVKALSEKLAESESWVFRLAGERQGAERDLALAQATATRLRQECDAAQAALRRVNDDLAVARTRHRQLDAERAAAVAGRAEALRDLRGVIELMTVEAQARADVISAERDDAYAMLNAERSRAEAAEAGCAEHAGLLDSARGELATLARMVIEVSDTAEARRAEAERARLEAERAAAETAHSQAEAAHIRAEAERSRSEAEAMREALAAETHRAGESAENAAWLAEVAATLQQQAWWWGFMPAQFAEARLNRRLKRRGLFDGDAYRARYPDVDDAGVSPIHHYLRHGFHENRERPV